MPQPFLPPGSGPAHISLPNRGRRALTDADLTDEFRKLTAKRSNAVRQTRGTIVNQTGATLIGFSLIGIGITRSLDRAHIWDEVEVSAMAVILVSGLVAHFLASTIARRLEPKD